MKNVLFILDYRAGSHLLLKLLLGRPAVEMDDHGKYLPNGNGTALYSPGKIVALSPYDFPLEIYFSDARKLADLPQGVHRYTYMGDWWGQVDSSDAVPDPYEHKHPTSWDYSNIRIISNWSVVRLVRDPRNHIESVRYASGERKNPHQVRDPLDYFIKQCKSMRNRLRVALDCETYCKNYKIFKSSDLVDDPMTTITAIDKFSGLNLDLDKISCFIEKERSSNAADLHSTFKSSSGYRDRYKSWSSKEMAIAESIFGKELLELGYN